MLTENEIRDKLAQNLNLIEPNLTLVKKEYHLPNNLGSKGFIDILATDNYGNYVIIEIKKSRSTSRETLQELLKYVGLIKQNYKAKDSEIRVIILSTDWEELFVPFCELYYQTSLSIKAFRIITNETKNLNNCDVIAPEPLSSNRRSIVPNYHIDLFYKEEKRNQHVKYLKQRSKSLGVVDYIILKLAGPNSNSQLVHPYATCYAYNSLTIDQYHRILEKEKKLDMSEDEFETIEQYEDYLQQLILVALDTSAYNDTVEWADPPKLDGILVAENWIVEEFIKHGIFASDPRLTNEMLLKELRGLEGSNSTKYLNFGESTQYDRISEIESNCFAPFAEHENWANNLKDIWRFIKSTKASYRIVINVFVPRSIFDSLWRYINEDNSNYLPLYLVFVDFFQENKLFVFQGGLSWNGNSVDLEKFIDFINNNEESLISKPIDMINGFYDDEIQNYFQLEWQNFVTIFDADKNEYGGLFLFDNDKLVINPPTNYSMKNWIENNLELIQLLREIYLQHTNYQKNTS